jgi:hypothetical protein
MQYRRRSPVCFIQLADPKCEFLYIAEVSCHVPDVELFTPNALKHFSKIETLSQ